MRLGALILIFWLTAMVNGFAQNRIAGDILVMLRHDAEITEVIKTIQTKFPAVTIGLGETVAPRMNIWLLKTAPATEQQVLDYVRSMPQVQVAQYNRIANERNTPNDTLYAQQWNFENTGQSSGIPGADIKAHLAWDLATGFQGITSSGDTMVVAVIDKGMELTHQDLLFWQNPYEIDGDSIDNDGNGYIDDVLGWNVAQQNDVIPSNSHGTMCAGLVGAKTNNLFGTAGVNWGLPIMPVICSQYNESQVVAAYAYIVEARKQYNQTNGAQGAFVVATSSSFGIDFGFAADYPIWCAMYDSLGKQGILNAGATANINLDVEASGDIPSTCISDYLIVVTNTTRTDYKNPSAGYGITSVDLGAPGTGIWSTTTGNGHSASTGTSFATPQVAGAVALMLSAADQSFMDAYKQYPDSMVKEVKRIMLQSVDEIPDLASNSTSGGRLNLYRAVVRFQNEYCQSCLTITSVVQNVGCHGESTGTITLAVDSGRSPYTYLWSNGDTTASAANLAAGNYTVTVTDSLGNTRQAYFTILQPTPLQTGFIVKRSTGQPDGSIVVLTQGGTAPYSYNWLGNISTTDTAQNLLPGTYGITVVDDNGCEVFDTVTVYLDSTVSAIGSIVSHHFKLYPNPTLGSLYFDIDGASGQLGLQVFDLMGSLVATQSLPVDGASTGSLSISHLAKGIYWVKVSLDDMPPSVFKIIKQ